MAESERVERTGFFTFIRSRRQVAANKARKIRAEGGRDLEGMDKDELQALADDLLVTPRASGASGNVLKTDLVEALQDAGLGRVSGPAEVNTATAPATGGKAKANTATTEV